MTGTVAMNNTQQRFAQGKSNCYDWIGMRGRLLRNAQRAMAGLALLSAGLASITVHAQETVCASVKIEIKQELTLERQGFEATMKIVNTLDSSSLEHVGVVIKVTDDAGVPVKISYDPNDLTAKFFIRVASKQAIADVDGNGTVAPSSTAIIDWLLIPAPGAAGNNPFGKKFLVGASLQYKFGGEVTTLDVSPAVITVKPLPLLTLDYFLPQDVNADDPLTVAVEPIEPFTLGVRVKNTGAAVAKNLKIESAQPKIIENKQGLLIGFKLDGSFVNDAPVQNTLLINFGDIPASTAKIGRWIMETTLSGKFTEFSAKFTHADELGGALTSLMKEVNTHFLIRDVRVDLPGRDFVRDFLALDGDVIRVYESDGPDSVVTNLSVGATLTAGAGNNGNALYTLSAPPTFGFVYVKLPDPYQGQKALGQIVRSDAKIMLPENVWLSKTKNAETKQWQYWLNFFDVNTTGIYSTEFKAPPLEARAPVIQFIPDRTVQEGKQVSFIVEASSPDGKPVTLSAGSLPAGATFMAQNAVAGLATSVFDWTPAKGAAGNYPITYTATDGTLLSSLTASIKVNTDAPPSGPTMPLLVAPLADAHVPSFKPTLIVQTGADLLEPTTQVQFEVYADSAMTQLIDSGSVDKGVTTGDAGTTSFKLTKDLNEDTRYWWRARAFDGQQTYSTWMNSKFFVNVANHPPESFSLTSPAPAIEVASTTPVLTWTNSKDLDEDAITYSVYVYKDAALSDLMTSVAALTPGAEGSTNWTVDKPLSNHVQYYWRVVAADSHGATTLTPARSFTVNTSNTAPTVPSIQSPSIGGQTATPSTALTIVNATDADNDLLTYVFELDTVNTFDSGSKQSSGQVIQSAASTTSWTVNNLIENKRYYWRVKTQDGHAESDWVVANFLMNAVNDPPPAPTIKNPGNAAWVGTQQPSLEANAVVDPEGETVRYEFAIYRDAALTQKATDGVSDNNAWTVPVALNDKTTHYWRVRAVDAQGTASPWSAPAIMYVSTGQYVDPTISVIAPATVQSPTVNGNQKTVTIGWEGTDPNIDPTIALYYSTSNSGYAGTLIVDGLKQAAGAQSGSYVWDVTALSPGAYYVYAVIYDAKGSGHAYAAGAVLIAPATPTGTIITNPADQLSTQEDGATTSFTVRLGSAPVSTVVVPISSSNARLGNVNPAVLTFTPQNWQTPQMVTVTGANNCAPDGNKSYQIRAGKATSLDPDYNDAQAAPIGATVTDNDSAAGNTGTAGIYICNYKVISEIKISATTWEYTLTAEMTNITADYAGATATLASWPSGTTAVDRQLVFGAAGKGDTVKAGDTFVLRSGSQLSQSNLQLGIGIAWRVSWASNGR